MRQPECAQCAAKALLTPGLWEACASVGIEHGTSTQEAFDRYLLLYHRGGHQGDDGRPESLNDLFEANRERLRAVFPWRRSDSEPRPRRSPRSS